ncbi:Synaptogyrin-3 [Halotydeus destructor]|nr:Synaptogyrin-3 [Halotydeus destructor]
MEGGVAFGAGKAGAPFDPIGFITRPQVALRFLCWIFSCIVFGCIQSKGWNDDKKCIFNNDGNACSLTKMVSMVGIVGAIALLVLEALFQQLSSIKLRRRAVAGDLGFSAAWAGLNVIIFLYLTIAWSKSELPRFGIGINGARVAMVFSLLAAPAWAGCAYFAYLRWMSGADMSQFAGGFEEVGQAQPGAEYAAQYTAQDAGGYQEDYAQQPAASNPFANYQPAY